MSAPDEMTRSVIYAEVILAETRAISLREPSPLGLRPEPVSAVSAMRRESTIAGELK